MSFQGYQGELDSQEGHGTLREEKGVQMMQLSQVQLAQIVCSAVSRAQIQHMQQTCSNCRKSCDVKLAFIQQVQPPTMFDIPAFEDDSAAS